MSNESPEPGEVWQEADGHLLQCRAPGLWARFGSPIPVAPNDPSIAFPLRRVFTKYGVPVLDDPVKEALLVDLDQAQKDRDRWRTKAVRLSERVSTVAHQSAGGPSPEEEQQQLQEEGYVPPPTTTPTPEDL